MNIFVARLSWDTDEETLRSTFEPYGEVDTVKIIIDRATGKSRGFGFVEMSNDEEGQAAIDALDQTELDGRTIVVKENDNNRGGGGGGGGGYRGGGGGGGYRGGGGGYDRGGDGDGGYRNRYNDSGDSGAYRSSSYDSGNSYERRDRRSRDPFQSHDRYNTRGDEVGGDSAPKRPRLKRTFRDDSSDSQEYND